MDRAERMAIESQRAQTLSAVSTVLSAFLVFVIGGGVVLKVWADERKAARMLPAADVASSAMAEPAQATEKAPTPDEGTVQSSVKRKSGKETPRKRSVARTVKAAKAAKASGSPTTTPEPVSGKGQVVVAGNASRVRLIGSNGTFGSGTVPAGSYTIQATFRGGDPRMAGTVQVADGQRIIIVCQTAGQRCVQR